MKHAVLLTVAASLADAASHGHRHLHRRGSGIVKRLETTTQWVPAIETVYMLNGAKVDNTVAANGIKDGEYLAIGSSEPTMTTPTPTPSSTSTTSTSTTSKPKSTSSTGGMFIEDYTSSSTHSSTTSAKPTTTSHSSTVKPTTTSHSSTQASSSAAASSSSSSSSSSSGSSSGSGVNAEFPSGKIKCSDFPSEYGAVAESYLGLDGWTGIQNVPNYSSGDSSISYIETATSGGCTKNSFCSYACPLGYSKAQWPSAQGSTGQSIGGLYCNSDGYLELSRSGYNTLCQAGAGGVYIQNDLSEQVATCRTDYPGTESMTIPAVAAAGAKIVLTNPYAPTAYTWEGSSTTAQYYVNKKGYSVADSCVWNSPVDSKGAGNWAPVNIGVGMDSSGTTYISIFPNTPTTTATLDFNIEITGDVSTTCKLVDGSYTQSTSGCTTSVKQGGTAIIRYYSS